MKTVIATTLALALTSATGTVFAETIKYSTKDAVATAGWSNEDECSYATIDVSGHQSVTRQSGTGPVSGSLVNATFSSKNWCTGEMHEGYAYGEGVLTIGNNSATIKASLVGYDFFTGESATVDVDLNIVANGEYKGKSVWRSTTAAGPVRTVSRQVGSYQSAEATGTLALNGLNLVSTDSIWGGLGKSNSGTIEIYKPDGLR